MGENRSNIKEKAGSRPRDVYYAEKDERNVQPTSTGSGGKTEKRQPRGVNCRKGLKKRTEKKKCSLFTWNDQLQ